MSTIADNKPFLTIPGAVITPLSQVQSDINEYLPTLSDINQVRAMLYFQEVYHVSQGDPETVDFLLRKWLEDQQKFR